MIREYGYILRMVGYGENIGSGFPKIIAAWKETNWGEPELKNKVELDEVERYYRCRQLDRGKEMFAEIRWPS